jgi:hypothetical protein
MKLKEIFWYPHLIDEKIETQRRQCVFQRSQFTMPEDVNPGACVLWSSKPHSWLCKHERPLVETSKLMLNADSIIAWGCIRTNTCLGKWVQKNSLPREGAAAFCTLENLLLRGPHCKVPSIWWLQLQAWACSAHGSSWISGPLPEMKQAHRFSFLLPVSWEQLSSHSGMPHLLPQYFKWGCQYRAQRLMGHQGIGNPSVMGSLHWGIE